MTASDAPYYATIADGPDSGRARWATAADGVRIRVGLWPSEDASGTVLIFPGRTEYIEKYGRAAACLERRGFAAMAVDWRGQGLAQRLLDDSRTGHVMRFADYQMDVAAALAVAEAENLPRPWFLLAHSMGGAIGLRALMEGLDVKAAAFSAPMWGIKVSRALRPVAWASSYVSRLVGMSHIYAPGTKPESYTETAPFEDNQLTTDREMWRWMGEQTSVYPALSLGGPSMQWLFEGLMETRTLARRPSPDYPCLTLLGDNERIVDTPRIHDRMARWPNGRLEMFERCEHEVLMERADLRERAFDMVAAHFDDHST